MQPISIDLTDTDPVALRMVLSYIYTDRILPTQEGKQKMCAVKSRYHKLVSFDITLNNEFNQS